MGMTLNLVKRSSVYDLDWKILFSWPVFQFLFANVSKCLRYTAQLLIGERLKIATSPLWREY